MNKEPKSKCCGAEILNAHKKGIEPFWYCANCHNACSPSVDSVIPPKEEKCTECFLMNSNCTCFCHRDPLNKGNNGYEHDIKCCDNMNGLLIPAIQDKTPKEDKIDKAFKKAVDEWEWSNSEEWEKRGYRVAPKSIDDLDLDYEEQQKAAKDGIYVLTIREDDAKLFLSQKEKEKKELVRCTKCEAPFLPHHHKHITREGTFHTSCYESQYKQTNERR